MSTPTNPSITPNVIVANPAVRKGVNIVLGIAGLTLPIAGILDQYIAGDWSPVLLPAGAIALFLAGAFGLSVTVPNIPSQSAQIAVEVVDEPVKVVGNPDTEYTPHV